jgi:hypothetical protein
MPTKSPLIALDADGVMINYHEGYANAWEQAFGYRPKIKDPQGYHPLHYWDVPLLSPAEREHLAQVGFTENVWRTMPAMAGAVEACELLQAAGCRLVCVTALRPAMQQARADNLKALGFKLNDVFAVGPNAAENPKLAQLTALAPTAFVDDFLPYLQGIPRTTWRALLNGRANNSPNYRPDLEAPDSRHTSLLDFAHWWLANRH